VEVHSASTSRGLEDDGKMAIFCFLARRLGQGLVALFGLSILIFILVRVVPGDPARLALGSVATEEAVQRLAKEMHLDEPIYKQYYYWLKDALRGNFGMSLYSRGKVLDDIKRTLPATLELSLFAMIISILVGQFLGITAARYHGTWVDTAARIIAYIGVVTPNFALALLLLMCFGYFTHFLPTVGRLSPHLTPPPMLTGFYTIDALIMWQFDVFLDALAHLLLPAIALAWASLAQESRITRASMVANLSADYILSDKASGLPHRVIFFKHLLKPSLVPTVSIMGPDLAYIVVNAFLVEKVFNWPGFARYGLEAILRKDLNAVMAVILILGVLFMVANILSDLACSFLDPRTRLQRGR